MTFRNCETEADYMLSCMLFLEILFIHADIFSICCNGINYILYFKLCELQQRVVFFIYMVQW